MGWFLARGAEQRLELEVAEERLWRTKKPGTEEHRNALWVFYLPFVALVAAKLKRRLPACVDRQDLLDDGQDGLLEALAHFEPQRAVRFTTYAQPRVHGAMLDGLRRRQTYDARFTAFDCQGRNGPAEHEEQDPLEELEKREAWQHLPEQHRALIILVFKGWTLKRAARVHGITEGRACQIVDEALTLARLRAM